MSLSRSLALTDVRLSGELLCDARDAPFRRCDGSAAIGFGAIGGGGSIESSDNAREFVKNTVMASGTNKFEFYSKIRISAERSNTIGLIRFLELRERDIHC